MEQIVVKSEMPGNSEILLFYVDENGGNEEGVLTTVENIENQAVQLQQDNSYVIEDVSELSHNINLLQTNHNEHWTEEDIKRLLIFYNDNKQTFISGATKKTHLWTVACKTMLVGKTPNSCEMQLESLKEKYLEICGHIQKGVYIKWPFFELCHQIFQDDVDYSSKSIEEYDTSLDNTFVKMPVLQTAQDEFVVVKKVNAQPSADEKVELMLNLYLKYKKSFQQEYWRRGLWDTIAMEIGEEDGEYWQKRFLNYKQHYLRLLDKRRESGPDGINWPYFNLFDKIFEDDKEFQKKHGTQDTTEIKPENVAIEIPYGWDTTEMTVLVKYYFDCFDEFEDPTIPNSFLWNDVGRLLDKTPDACQQKYEELKNEHLDKFTEETYEMRTRKPIEIIFDNIISKEIELQIKESRNQPEQLETWKTGDLDELVQFFYDKIDMYKDPVCHYVCWAAVVKKLKRSLQSCKGQWEDLVTLYKTILNDKKENPDMQIDWRYIEVFDRICDYGMDVNLLAGYHNLNTMNEKTDSSKVGVKKVNINLDENSADITDDDESFDERGFTKRTKRHVGDSKAFKILEYYQKNKDKFNTTKRNKHSLWEVLAKQIGISALKCSHRFRNLKQVYTAYVQREINKPEMPIVWPYYALCKKVFGYRAIKSKLKQGKLDSDDSEEWTAKEIKQLINYFSRNFHEINDNLEILDKWSSLAKEIGKSENSCKEKFLELRKSYRKLNTMRTRNPDVKISWKYFKMFEQIYKEKEADGHAMEVDGGEDYLEMHLDQDETNEQGEEDYQCIIVIPEGDDISSIDSAQIIVHDDIETQEDDIETNRDDMETQRDDIVTQREDIETQRDDIVTQREDIETQRDDFEIQRDNIETQRDDIETQRDDIETQRKNIETQRDDMETLRDDFAIQRDDMETQRDDIETQQIETAKPQNKWTKLTKKRLLILCINYLRLHRGKKININDMWVEISSKLKKSPIICRKMFAKLKANHKKCNEDDVNKTRSPYYNLIEKIICLKPSFAKSKKKKDLSGTREYKDVQMPDDKIEQALRYYLQHIEEFVSPKFEKKYLWTELANYISEPVNKVFNKINYLKQRYNNDTDLEKNNTFSDLLKEISAKEIAIKLVTDNEPKPVIDDTVSEETWSDDETEQLLEWYLSNLEKFKNPKFVRSYLWMEIASILNKSAIVCSKKMSETRTQYRNMVRERPEDLSSWRFHDLCQKIYGTGKKGNAIAN